MIVNLKNIYQNALFYRLQKILFELNEKYKQIESTCIVQKLVIKKQMSHINRKIEQQKKIADYVVKRDKNIYIKLWSLHQNNIINCINNVLYTSPLIIILTIILSNNYILDYSN